MIVKLLIGVRQRHNFCVEHFLKFLGLQQILDLSAVAAKSAPCCSLAPFAMFAALTLATAAKFHVIAHTDYSPYLRLFSVV